MSARPTAESVQRGREILRREGMADAACRLVAMRLNPAVKLDDYRAALGLTQVEVQAALQRRRGFDPLPAGAPKPKRPATETSVDVPRPHRCTEPGCDNAYPTGQGLASHRLAAHGEPVPCPAGCGRMVNPRGVGAHARHCPGAPNDGGHADG